MFYADNEGRYEGQFNNNVINGVGSYFDKDNNVFSGEWKEGNLSKQYTTETNPDNPTNCTRNCVDGYGWLSEGDKVLFQGIFKESKIIYGYANIEGNRYTGNLTNNKPNGYGQINYTTGDIYFGYFKEGKKEGLGTMFYSDGIISSGVWKKNDLNSNDMLSPKTHLFKDFNQTEFTIAIKKTAQLTKRIRYDR